MAAELHESSSYYSDSCLWGWHGYGGNHWHHDDFLSDGESPHIPLASRVLLPDPAKDKHAILIGSFSVPVKVRACVHACVRACVRVVVGWLRCLGWLCCCWLLQTRAVLVRVAWRKR
jgi:hypothetical protein